jgi:hypothetical protein
MNWSVALHVVACVIVPVAWGAAVHWIFHRLLPPRNIAAPIGDQTDAAVDELPS